MGPDAGVVMYDAEALIASILQRHGGLVVRVDRLGMGAHRGRHFRARYRGLRAHLAIFHNLPWRPRALGDVSPCANRWRCGQLRRDSSPNAKKWQSHIDVLAYIVMGFPLFPVPARFLFPVRRTATTNHWTHDGVSLPGLIYGRISYLLHVHLSPQVAVKLCVRSYYPVICIIESAMERPSSTIS